jgi:hypothetical protein
VNKSPAAANLFLCEDNPDTVAVECTGAGEGDLTLNEIVNVPGLTGDADPNPPHGDDGVGAYEFQVKFDHKIFNVDISDGGWLTGGTVGRTLNCNHTVITENWVLFGCTTTGNPNPGAASGVLPDSGTLATVNLTPNEDLKFRLHPGNDNGVVRMILDENCELANIWGEPLPGSINGGLTLQCGDAAVTVRILEGDLNLDCIVNGLDAQAIAFRYGAFFGNINYDPWYDMEPALKDFDIDIKDLQKVYGRDGSTCQNPIPPQPPLTGLSVGPL